MRLLISGGGTGGGTYPAIAVAQALKAQYSDAEILWIGSKGGIEKGLVENAGLPFKAVSSGPLVGKGVITRLSSAIKIMRGTLTAWGIIGRFKPDAFMMTGGWPVLPATIASKVRGVPMLILLPDIEPGSTIKLLSGWAARVATTTPMSAQYFEDADIVEAGYPLRPDLLRAAGFDAVGNPVENLPDLKAQAAERFSLDAEVPTVLIFGGSKGTRSLNEAALNGLKELAAAANIIHISGSGDWEYVQARAVQRLMADMSGELREEEEKTYGRDTIDLDALTTRRYHPFEYLHTEDMALALSAADLVVSRSGASTLGEFPLFELPAILVPYPFTWRYQKINADFLVERGAALRVDDEKLGEELIPTVLNVLSDDGRRNSMAAAMKSLKRPDAAAQVAAALVEMAAN